MGACHAADRLRRLAITKDVTADVTRAVFIDSVYAGRQLDADLHNKAVQAFNQRVFEATSVPLAVIATAHRSFYLIAPGGPQTTTQPHAEIQLRRGGAPTARDEEQGTPPSELTSPVDEAGAIQAWDTLLGNLRT